MLSNAVYLSAFQAELKLSISVMNIFQVFIPHILGITGAILCMVVVRSSKDTLLVISLPAYALLFLLLVGLTPSQWMRSKPTSEQKATTIVILSFGYEEEEGRLKPGKANEFLWDWVIENQASQMETVLVQEGTWATIDEGEFDKLDIKRIHQHDPKIYVNTLDTAFCAIRQLQRLGKKKVMLVAHDLQLQRVAWDFERARQEMCLDCELVIPNLPDTPYPVNSVHFHTRNEFIYKIIELLISRPRDFLSPVPNQCKAPLNY